MKYKFTINFIGTHTLEAESEMQAMTRFREWIRTAPGDLWLDGYNCIGCELVEDEEFDFDTPYEFSDFAYTMSHKYGVKSTWRKGEGTVCAKCGAHINWNSFPVQAYTDYDGDLICPACKEKV